MDDDIQLPPLPPFSMAPVADTVTVRDYARAAVLADRERRALWEAQPAKPKLHSMTFSVGRNGSWSCYPPSIYDECATVTIRWTDDGRAWIDSERNRELAESLRGLGFPQSANALDGGVR